MTALSFEPSESQIQSAVISWWAMYCKTVGLDERLLMASASGAWLGADKRRAVIQMARLKREGFRIGVPDLLLALPFVDMDKCLIFAGMFIEMKAKKGILSTPQIEYQALLRKQDYNVITCYSAESAIVAIKAYVSSAQNAPGRAQDERRQARLSAYLNISASVTIRTMSVHRMIVTIADNSCAVARWAFRIFVWPCCDFRTSFVEFAFDGTAKVFKLKIWF